MNPEDLPPYNQRREIREALARLLLFNTAAAERVTPNRTIPVSDTQLPQISIYTLSEEVKLFNRSPRIYERDLQLVVEIHSGGERWDDEGDFISAEVEQILEQNAVTAEHWEELFLRETSQADNEDGRIPLGATRLVYSVLYKTHPVYEDPASAPAFDPAPAVPA